MKFTTLGADTEPVLKFFLETSSDDSFVTLRAADHNGRRWFVARISKDGFHAYDGLPDEIGFALDDDGRIAYTKEDM